MGTVNSIQSIHSPNNDHNKVILTNSSHSLVGRQIEKVRCVAQKAIASIRNGAHTSYRFIADNRKVILITLGTVISSAGLFVVSVLCAKNISQNMRSKRQEPVRVSIPAPAAMLVAPVAKVEEPVKVESVKIEPIKPVKPVLKVYVPNANKELLSAVVLHDFKKVKKILDEWIVDIDYRDYNNGMTFLHNAVSRNNKKIAALLLEHGANPNVESLYTKETPLYTAFLKGKTNLMSLLMDNNAKFNVSKNNNPSYQQVKIFIENDDVDPTVKERLLKYIEKEFEIDILGERLLYDRKKLAHAWGMSGRCSVPGVFVKEDLEGHYGLQTSSFQMKKAAQKFLSKEEVSKHDRQGFFTKEVIGTILEAVEKMDVNYSEKLRSSQEILDDINKGKPVIIPMSWLHEAHAITIVIYGDFVIRCNRGACRDSFAITIGERKKPITPDVIRRIRNKENQYYFLNDIVTDLGLRNCSSLNIQQKDQYVGNCTWASPKSAFYALFFMEALKHSSASVRAEPRKYAKEAYKAFTSFTRLNQLEQFLKDYPKLRPSDEIIVRSIKEKTLVKLSKEGISPAQKQHFQRVLEIIKEVEKKREREFLIRENVKMALANITRNTEQGRRADVTRQHDYLKQETSFIA